MASLATDVLLDEDDAIAGTVWCFDGESHTRIEARYACTIVATDSA